MASVQERLQSIIAKANATTGKTDADVTAATQSLVDGFGGGGGAIKGSLTLPDDTDEIAIPYEGADKKRFIAFAQAVAPRYGINNELAGLVIYEIGNIASNNIVSGSNKNYHIVWETRTSYPNYTNVFSAYTAVVDVNTISIGSRSAAYKFQAGEYEYYIWEV